MELDPNIVLIVVVSTLSTIYGMGKMLQFKVSENRKQREHLQKQRKTKLDNDLELAKLGKSGDIDKLVDKFDIGKLLEDVEDEDDIDDLPIPSFLKPLAKGFLKKFLEGRDLGTEPEKKKQNY